MILDHGRLVEQAIDGFKAERYVEKCDDATFMRDLWFELEEKFAFGA
jgi:hypothetical protein